MNRSFKHNGHICIAGAGMIGTALGNRLASGNGYKVRLFTVEPDVAETINGKHINQKYFPNMKLSRRLLATTDPHCLNGTDVIFLAVPSTVIVEFIASQKNEISHDTILINLAKGFGTADRIITDCLEEIIPNPVCSLKGPTFAREILSSAPTAFTFASRDKSLFPVMADLFGETGIYLDFTNDVHGVEIVSILKNIYAIALGIVDAHFNSPNLRFLVLTRAFAEMRKALVFLGGQEETLYHYCGYGDFSLTALNDLSRNRTLGLLIGKGFFIEDISDKVVLEGRIALNVFINKFSELGKSEQDFPILFELFKVFNLDYKVSNFVNNLLVRIDSRIEL
ncbi:MAG: NAD(P)-binding domain-containing protein [Bacteroidetes bacterium]|nr:NAD(P)-binding domain-containing protein [Bacteroidota bacterium]